MKKVLSIICVAAFLLSHAQTGPSKVKSKIQPQINVGVQDSIQNKRHDSLKIIIQKDLYDNKKSLKKQVPLLNNRK